MSNPYITPWMPLMQNSTPAYVPPPPLPVLSKPVPTRRKPKKKKKHSKKPVRNDDSVVTTGPDDDPAVVEVDDSDSEPIVDENEEKDDNKKKGYNTRLIIFIVGCIIVGGLTGILYYVFRDDEKPPSDPDDPNDDPDDNPATKLSTWERYGVLIVSVAAGLVFIIGIVLLFRKFSREQYNRYSKATLEMFEKLPRPTGPFRRLYKAVFRTKGNRTVKIAKESKPYDGEPRDIENFGKQEVEPGIGDPLGVLGPANKAQKKRKKKSANFGNGPKAYEEWVAAGIKGHKQNQAEADAQKQQDSTQPQPNDIRGELLAKIQSRQGPE